MPPFGSLRESSHGTSTVYNRASLTGSTKLYPVLFYLTLEVKKSYYILTHRDVLLLGRDAYLPRLCQ